MYNHFSSLKKKDNSQSMIEGKRVTEDSVPTAPATKVIKVTMNNSTVRGERFSFEPKVTKNS